jgi:selenide,water dikinase
MPEAVLVSSETGDDAACYVLPDGQVLVQTVDFFTPIVDDPYDWGRIAAANAFSDVYAMGGRPVLALNLVGWPVEELSLDLLGRVLKGGAKVAAEAGVVICGGHSITDPEPKYGMAVTGFADRDHVVRNSTAPEGGTLFLTKPLGTGIITTAIKRRRATSDQARLAVETMTELNAAAAEAMVEAGVEAATDVTGFGLLGHLHFMLRASGVSAMIDASAFPLLPGVLELGRDGVVPGGTERNHAFVDDFVEWGALTAAEQLILADAQTSGGLLMATRDGERLREVASRRGVSLFEVGRTLPGQVGTITVTGRL